MAPLALGGAPVAEAPPHAAKRERAAHDPHPDNGGSGCAHCSTQDDVPWGAGLAFGFGLLGLAGLTRRRRAE